MKAFSKIIRNDCCWTDTAKRTCEHEAMFWEVSFRIIQVQICRKKIRKYFSGSRALTSFSGLHQIDEHVIDTWSLCQHQRLKKKGNSSLHFIKRFLKILRIYVLYFSPTLTLTCTWTSWNRDLSMDTAEPGGSILHLLCKTTYILVMLWTSINKIYEGHR